jgi:hypothetical protein
MRSGIALFLFFTLGYIVYLLGPLALNAILSPAVLLIIGFLIFG